MSSGYHPRCVEFILLEDISHTMEDKCTGAGYSNNVHYTNLLLKESILYLKI